MTNINGNNGGGPGGAFQAWVPVVALIVGADQAAVRLGGRLGVDDDLALTYASLDLSHALGELEWAMPGISLGVEPTLTAEPGATDEAVRAAIVSKVAHARELVSRIAGDATATSGVVILATRVGLLLATVLHELTGGSR